MQTHPAQWVGLKALRRGLGVGGKRESKKESDPPSTVDGLEGIEKRGGHWGNKKRKNKSNK
jgi:hypothetical protein